MRTIEVKPALNDEQMDRLMAEKLGDSSFDMLVREPLAIIDPTSGRTVLKLIKDVISKEACAKAYSSLLSAAVPTNNRGMSAGKVPGTQSVRKKAKPLKGGGVSSQIYAMEVPSGIAGYFDRSARFPYCRQTAWTAEHVKEWTSVIPYLQEVTRVFEKYEPERYAAQLNVVRQTSPDFVIPGTVFTTVTINKNWQTAVHRDAGDLEEGCGVMSAFKRGQWSGCYLVFPRYRVAVEFLDGDVLLANVHEWHGNTPLRIARQGAERLSFIMYYREKMRQCGTIEDELRRAKQRNLGVQSKARMDGLEFG